MEEAEKDMALFTWCIYNGQVVLMLPYPHRGEPDRNNITSGYGSINTL
jgi:hypothetical protein